jgi:hypothetical protein
MSEWIHQCATASAGLVLCSPLYNRDIQATLYKRSDTSGQTSDSVVSPVAIAHRDISFADGLAGTPRAALSRV